MILPEKIDMLPFASYSISDFEKWLSRGLEKYLIKNSVWGFEPIAVFIGQAELFSIDLSNIYNVLPSKKCQRIFCKAVGNLILKNREDPIVLKELVSLAIYLRIIKIKPV